MHTRSQTGEMPASNAQRFDDLESKLDKLLELQTATNTLMSSLTTRVDSIDNKLEKVDGEAHEHATQLSTQKEAAKQPRPSAGVQRHTGEPSARKKSKIFSTQV